MFRKAHMKLFGIITAILLALFIAVLGSVNIIMKMVMERQSRTVLKQIAAGVEYDDTVSDFNYLPPDKFEPDGHMIEDPPPSKPEGEPGNDGPPVTTTEAVTETTTVTTSSTTTTADVTTEADTEAPVEEETFEEETPYSEPEIIETEPAAQPETEAPKTETPKPQEPVTQQPSSTSPSAPPKDKNSDKHSEEERIEPNENDKTPSSPQYPQWYGDPYWNGWGWGWGWGWGQPYNPYWGDPNGQNKGDDKKNEQQWNFPYQAPKPEAEPESKEIQPDIATDEAPDADDAEESTEAASAEDTGIGSLNGNGNGSIASLANTSAGNNVKDSGVKRNFPKRAGAEQVPKSLGSIDFFIVMADTSGNFLASRNNDELTEDTAQKYINKILDSGSDTGTLNNFQFYRQDKDNGTLLVFTDKSAELDMLNKLYRTTITIGALSFLALTAAAYFLSRQIIKPLKSAFEKQKQFVSDASHELKTPVTVISANADVLAGEIGENKWLTYIKSQTERMNILVNDLLNLTRLENNTSTDFIVTEFDLSKAIINTALPFECQAFENNKNFVVQVEDGISISGSEKHIKQMAAIFIDNALKYSKDGGTVKVTLERLGDKKVFSVFNTGQGIKEEDKDKIFERFFRSDESRNRATGGYGLGLAIAKSIIDKHKFKVHVENNEGSSICFVVTM